MSRELAVDLEELERLASKAFCAPWTYENWTIDCPQINDGNECGYEHNLTTVIAPHEYPGSADEPGVQVIAQIDVPGLEQFADANGALIVAMRNALPSLIAELRQLRAHSNVEYHAKFWEIATVSSARIAELTAERDALKADNERLQRTGSDAQHAYIVGLTQDLNAERAAHAATKAALHRVRGDK